YTLDTQNNAITTLAGSTGTVSFRDDTGFTIGTVNTIGLTTSGATTLQTLATVDETAPLAATTLTLKGAGATYSLGTQNNNVTTLNANTDQVATLSFRDDNGFDVSGINSAGDVTLSSTGTVTQSAAPIQATGLELLGVGGTYTLDTQNNAVTTLAANTGTVKFQDNTGFDVGTVNTVGVTTSGNTTLSSTGTVTQSQVITAAGLELLGAAGAFNLDTQKKEEGRVGGSIGTGRLREDIEKNIGK